MPGAAEIEAKYAWIERVFGVALRRAEPGDAPQPAGGNGHAAAMLGWQAARAEAIRSLNDLAGAVAAAKLMNADRTVILLRAIRANLTETPQTSQQIEALRNYLEEDDVIDAAETPNGYGIKIDLRDRLLDALDAFEAA